MTFPHWQVCIYLVNKHKTRFCGLAKGWQWDNHQHIKSPNRVCWQPWNVEGKELIKKEKLRDRRRINSGSRKKGELSYSCCKGLCLLKPRHGQIVVASRGSDAVKGFTGHMFSYRQKTSQKITCYSRKQDDSLSFSLLHSCFLLGVNLRFWYFS